MNLRFVDWIWHVRGSLRLPPGQSSDDAFDRLAPLFRQSGTSHERTDDTLVFQKKGQAAQDKMSIFDGGIVRIEKGMAGAVLHYHLTSRALLACFLAPLLFIAFGQLTIAVGKLEKPATETASRTGKDTDEKKAEKKKADVPMNPIDKFLGAPAPEKPDKDKDKDKDKDEGDNDKHSPTAAYVFAVMFAVLYVVGRILEDRLINRLFKKRLLEA